MSDKTTKELNFDLYPTGRDIKLIFEVFDNVSNNLDTLNGELKMYTREIDKTARFLQSTSTYKEFPKVENISDCVIRIVSYLENERGWLKSSFDMANKQLEESTKVSNDLRNQVSTLDECNKINLQIIDELNRDKLYLKEAVELLERSNSSNLNTDKLAAFIATHFQGEFTEKENSVDIAIRIIEDLNNKVVRHNHDYYNLTKECIEHKKQIDSDSRYISELRTENEELNETIYNQGSSIEELKIYVSELKSYLSELKSYLSELKEIEELKTLFCKYRDGDKFTSKSTLDMLKQLQSLQLDNQRLHETIHNQGSSIIDLNLIINDKNNESVRLNNKIEDLQSQICRYKESDKESYKAISDMLNQIEKLQIVNDNFHRVACSTLVNVLENKELMIPVNTDDSLRSLKYVEEEKLKDNSLFERLVKENNSVVTDMTSYNAHIDLKNENERLKKENEDSLKRIELLKEALDKYEFDVSSRF